MVSLAFAIAASANFPVLFMSVLWKDCTTKAVIGGFLGLFSSAALTTSRQFNQGRQQGQEGGKGRSRCLSRIAASRRMWC